MSGIELSRRDRQPEVMDDPSLDESLHRDALRGLSRVNRISSTVGSLWTPIRSIIERKGSARLLDVACGGGDLAIGLARRAARERRSLQVVGCDISEFALRFARAQAGDAPVTFERLDVFQDPIPPGFDIVTCSLFLHHLDEAIVIALFRKIIDSGAELFLASDLRRGRLAYGLTWLVTRILSRSRVVHVDGPLSVRAAFTIPEILALAEQGGLNGANARAIWPFRFLLTWERPQ